MKFRIEAHDGAVEIDFFPISSYDSFELLGAFLEDEFGAILKEKIEGPDARVWELEVRGVPAKLVHKDDVGNSLTSEAANAAILFKGISERLAEKLG